ncbi:four-carbon acid sugar kinase family protein [uncultured Roseobacter sp.]|uniref:four-carbon acid sugar kinase family protein n=1 Tax=uncultured Roseobacter sp. TaxID=114847 RepID=UPI002619FCD6|nr:four-carbon acid sugar kinase family protein [uncultured Roseobacter sp.]
MNTISVAIIADDLSSAADAAAPFLPKGLTARVGRKLVPLEPSDVVAVDVGSRSMPEPDAASAVRVATAALNRAQIVFKTVDSTLRGHAKAEISAAFEASGRSRLIFAPAFPAAGRVTVNGIQYVDSTPVHLSHYRKDPVNPVSTSRLSDLLPANATQAIVFDAQSQEDLNRQVREFSEPETALWVGSPGLALALAARIGRPGRRVSMSRASGQCLVVVGSANPVSHRQAAKLNSNATVVLKAPEKRLANHDRVLSDLADKAVVALRSGRFGALLATGGDTMDAILDRIGAPSFKLCGEFAPGCPVGQAEIDGRTLLIGMKAGGFGDEDTLRQAVDTLTPRKQDQAS